MRCRLNKNFAAFKFCRPGLRIDRPTGTVAPEYVLQRQRELYCHVLTDQLMYFDDDEHHFFKVLNLRSKNPQPQTLPSVHSLTPFAIAVDANFVYLSNQNPRCVELLTVNKSMLLNKCVQNRLSLALSATRTITVTAKMTNVHKRKS